MTGHQRRQFLATVATVAAFGVAISSRYERDRGLGIPEEDLSDIDRTTMDTGAPATRTTPGADYLRAFNARAYGATGDGTTDDTAALNAWISAAATAGAPLYLPAGTYKITSALAITWWPAFQLFGDGMTASRIFVVGSGVDGITLTPPNGFGRGPLLQDFSVLGGATTSAAAPGTTGDGITWLPSGTGQTVSGPQMHRVRVECLGGHGIRVKAKVDWLHFEDCQSNYNGGHGIYFNTQRLLATIARIQGGSCGGNGGAGVKATGNLTLLTIIGHEASFSDVGYAFDTSESSGLLTGYLHLIGCRSEAVTTRHVAITGSIAGAKIDHYDALTTPANGGAMIKVDTARDVMIRGVLARAMVGGTAVVEEANGAHVTYQDMEKCVSSVVSGTGYMRKDPAGLLYKPIAGLHSWGISQETTVFSSNLNLSTGFSGGGAFVMDCNSASRTLTLPDATLYKGRLITAIKRSNTNTMTVAASGSQLLNGLSSLSFKRHGDAVTATSDGVAWYTVSRTDLGRPANMLTDAATIAVDATLGKYFTVTPGGNRTLGNPTGAYDGQELLFNILQDAAGSRTLTLGTKYRLPSGFSITLSTAAGKKDKLLVQYDATADKFDVILFQAGY